MLSEGCMETCRVRPENWIRFSNVMSQIQFYSLNGKSTELIVGHGNVEYCARKCMTCSITWGMIMFVDISCCCPRVCLRHAAFSKMACMNSQFLSESKIMKYIYFQEASCPFFHCKHLKWFFTGELLCWMNIVAFLNTRWAELWQHGVAYLMSVI